MVSRPPRRSPWYTLGDALLCVGILLLLYAAKYDGGRPVRVSGVVLVFVGFWLALTYQRTRLPP